MNDNYLIIILISIMAVLTTGIFLIDSALKQDSTELGTAMGFLWSPLQDTIWKINYLLT